MKLKRLQLQGYKTFATKTDFDFDEGITAIVGPNGSGKSNIADAVRWVLGEQSYSTLRGKRTADMIFAGSQSRSRAGMAQAILTLDNSDGWLPIDYSEVEIGRRAYRSGENEYLINGQRVRLRDVQDLLATSGLAERTYTIIGQGLIDQALSLRADERRALFEEAAGISHYQTKRATTLRRLEETQRNLERVHDILAEIRPRLGALKRQANRARNYEQVEADLRHLLRIWYGYQWEQKKEALRKQRQLAHDAEVAWKESREKLVARQTEIDRYRREIAQLRDQIAEANEERDAVREQLERARREVAVLDERRSLLQHQLADVTAELPRLRAQHEGAQSELATALSELEASEERLRDKQARLDHFNQSFQEQQAEIDRAKARVSFLERQQRERQKALAQAEGQLEQLRERLEDSKFTARGRDEMDRAVAVMQERSATLDERREAVKQLQTRRSAVQEERGEARQAARVAQEAEQRASDEVAQLSAALARLEARCDLLDQMRQKEVKIESDVDLVGQIARAVRIPSQYEVAVAAALGARLNTLVLADEAALWQLLQTNGEEQTVLAAVLGHVDPPSPPPLPQHAEVIGWAIDMVQTESEVEPVARLLFAPVLLVGSRRAAYTLGAALPAGAIAVAPDGFVVHAGGLVEASEGNFRENALARETAWREAQAQLLATKKAITVAREKRGRAGEDSQAAEATLEQLLATEKHVEQAVQQADRELAQSQREVDRAEQQIAFLQRQNEQREQERTRLQERIATTEAHASGVEQELDRVQNELTAARAHLASLPLAEAEQQRATRRQEIESVRTIVAGRQAVVESRRATLHQIDGQLRRLEDRHQRLRADQHEASSQDEMEKLQRLQIQLDTVNTALEPLIARVQAQREAVAHLEDGMLDVQRQAHELETYYTQMQVALTQRDNQLAGLMERIRADLGLVALDFDEETGGQSPLPMAEVVDRLPRVDTLPEKIEDTIQDYRGQLHRIGSINPDAPAEYEETQERYEFLSQQVEDLNRTEKRLRHVIAELDDLTSKAFAATVKEVDQIFGTMFERLFGGGSARLILTEPDQLTESGVDIVCRLPSRRQQRLGLLSGGERSLTAAALIFALLKVAPPPFCMLDEVDAMLDEANVTRFRSVLSEFGRDSQFIVITHNRGTVQAARTVYGISMGSDSSSQVISIKPETFVNGGSDE